MKKILICLVLCLCMLTPLALSGCGGEETDPNANYETVRDAVTLSFWIITEEETTPEAQAAMQEAFNDVSEAKYTTHVEFVFCTEEEYKEKLDAKFTQIDGRPSGSNSRPSGQNETYVDEDGMTVLKYPDVGTYQMDILLITGKDMLTEYVDAGRLQSLNDSINNTYSNITKYIYNDILNNAMVNGTWFAVPNNSMIGEYTFLLVNKEMAAKYYFQESDFTGFGTGTAAAELIDLIAENEDADQIAPMLGMADYPLVKYWTRGDIDKAVISTLYPSAGTPIGNGVTATNLFADANYRSFMNEMFYCKENGYFLTNQTSFGVGVVADDYSAYATYGEEYYVIPLSYPRLEDEDVFGSMFAVSSYTADLARSMEIITALTCDSELRNILQYGVEDVHYELREDGTLHRLNHDYMMNINYTGNVMMAYPEEGMSPDVWETAILQNQQSMLSVVFGTSDYLKGVDMEAWDQMCSVSSSYFERMYMCETSSEFNSYLDAASQEITASDYYQALVLDILDSYGNYITTSINGSIQKWWTDVYGSAT